MVAVLLGCGGDVFRVQKILGHSSPEMTRRCVNLQTADLQQVHQKFSAFAVEGK
jgi:integrase/recombinase XerD